MKKDIAIVLDCGATNVRVVAMNTFGKIVASHSMPNETDEDPYFEGGRIWDLEKLWQKLCTAAKEVTRQIDTTRIAGVTVTTFGVDGAFVDEKGDILYPVVSWQCERTQPIMDSIDKYISLDSLYEVSGVFPYAFNTINKMIWFKENRPEIIEKAHRFLFIPSLLIHKLSGAFKNDATMMGTSMMGYLEERQFSEKILSSIGVDADLFGEIGESGEEVGSITQQALNATGLPVDTPVLLAGHDTQFALFGSGANLNQPVLSSGTWEILMARSASFSANKQALNNNLTTEMDAQCGICNIGQNWLGSGVLEWFSQNFYPGLSGDELFETMISDAEKMDIGEHGLTINPAFYNDGTSALGGSIIGLTLATKREHIYRALLESLAFRLRESLEALQEAGNFKAERIICVGGGSKNRLWNQLRADICQLPIQLIDQKETTVLGAALFVFAGVGVFADVNEARKNIEYNPKLIEPSNSDTSKVQNLYTHFLQQKKNA